MKLFNQLITSGLTALAIASQPILAADNQAPVMTKEQAELQKNIMSGASSNKAQVRSQNQHQYQHQNQNQHQYKGSQGSNSTSGGQMMGSGGQGSGSGNGGGNRR